MELVDLQLVQTVYDERPNLAITRLEPESGIRAAGVGTLEIKQRGTGIDPDQFRRRFRKALSGSTSELATLVLARVGSGQMAYWCRAVRGPLSG